LTAKRAKEGQMEIGHYGALKPLYAYAPAV
jgi:hypothetical protein